MHYLFLLPNLSGGGAERVSVILANLLSARNHRVSLIIVQQKGELFDYLNESVELHVLKQKKTIFSLLSVRRKILSLDPDVVISNTHRMNVVTFFASRMHKKTYQLFLRLPNSPKAEIKYGEMSKHLNYVYKYVYQRADVVIAQTEEMKRQAREIFAVPEKKIRVLINPIDKRRINEMSENVSSPFSDGINIVAAGRLTYAKGFDVLIKAFGKAEGQLPHATTLHIIGADKGEFAELKKLVESLGLSNKVIFHGFQSNPYQYFKYADLYVLSSRWEGLPNTLLENLYLEKPVVATRCVPMVSDLIQQGENGFLVDVEDEESLAAAIINYKRLKPKTYHLNSEEEVEKILS